MHLATVTMHLRFQRSIDCLLICNTRLAVLKSRIGSKAVYRHIVRKPWWHANADCAQLFAEMFMCAIGVDTFGGPAALEALDVANAQIDPVDALVPWRLAKTPQST